MLSDSARARPRECLLHLGTLLPQRDAQWRLVARRDARALAPLADGLHAVRDDRYRQS
jgi:hypothetical protein